MYTQLFGSYLLSRGIIDQDQLMKAISRLSQTRLKIGTIAMHKGLMTAAEVDECLYLQTREDKRFGEIAIDHGYLTEEQVKDLLNEQVSNFLLLGQTLVEDGCFDNSELERLVFEYQSEAEFYELDYNVENKEKVDALIEKFLLTSELNGNAKHAMYLQLLFNSLLRFIGDDFTPLSPLAVKEYPVTFAVSQKIIGEHEYVTTIDMDRETAIEFASRYANDFFDKFDEYVVASIEDFINLHNGLFLVNMSNDNNSSSLTLTPPTEIETGILPEAETSILIPVVFPFGRINLIVSF